MGNERLKMEGQLYGLENETRSLKLKIEGLCSLLRENLNTALTPIQELEMPMITEQARELELTYAILQGKEHRIARLNRELGRG
jgi:hypothetical protein